MSEFQVLLRNVPFDATEEDILRLFTPHVQPQSLIMLRHREGKYAGEFLGVAYLNLSSMDDLETVLGLGTMHLFGRQLSVVRPKSMRQRVQATVLFQGVAPEIGQTQIEEALWLAGSIAHIHLFDELSTDGKRNVLVEMMHPSAVNPVLEMVNSNGLLEDTSVTALPIQLEMPIFEAGQLVADAIANALDETNPNGVAIIRDIVAICGVPFSQNLLAETQVVEAAGGMETTTGERRTAGGVYFQLAKQKLTPMVRNVLFRERDMDEDEEDGDDNLSDSDGNTDPDD